MATSAAEQRLDGQTGLLSLSALRDAIDRSMARKRATPGDTVSMAVLAVHLDRLAEIVECRSPDVEAHVIQAVAERLNGCVRAQDEVGHAGKGSFYILLDPLHTPELAASLAAKIGRVLRLPFNIEPQPITLSASIGIRLFRQENDTAERLVDDAEQAMENALGVGDCYRFAGSEYSTSGNPAAELDADPREGLDNGQFELHYQPRIELAEQRVVAAEALLRWWHPLHGSIPPSGFIPVAESTHLIHEIGEWVLVRACAQAAIWNNHGSPPIAVSVNVSGRQLDHPAFARGVERILGSTGLPPGLLELEITETALMHRPNEIAATLERLRTLGVRVALDDFGTGYSSLAYLRQLPLDTLKIDRSFVNDVAETDDKVVLLRSIIDLAHALGLRVVAEGVETETQRHALEKQDCDEIQGHLFCPALAAGGFEHNYVPSRGVAPTAL